MKHPARLALVFAVTLVACTQERQSVQGTPSGDALVAALQGHWCVSDDGGRSCWGYDRFEGKTIHACGRYPEDGRAFAARASFTMNGQTACYTVVESDDTKAFPLGHRFCAKVLEINDKFQRYEFDGDVFVTYRVQPGQAVCPAAAQTGA